MNKLYSNIFKEVSDELNIPVDLVERAYKACWKFTKQKVREANIREA